MRTGLLFLAIFFHSAVFSQSGTWYLIGGDGSINDAGNYGTKGVPSASNLPPARYQCAYWTDKLGNFWIFGGDSRADLWKYTVSNNMWTWISGSNASSSNGFYGPKGVPSVNYYPKGRGLGANCWTDTSGNLWLFGGYHPSGELNDLWKYNIATNEWTWVKGDNPNVGITTATNYGTKNIPTNSNFIGIRYECKSGWVYNNELYTFGGTTANGMKNDLWKYSIATNQWTWISGENTLNSSGNYGTKNVPITSNVPPSRWSYTKWKVDSMLYIFGGNNNAGVLNDVWSYNIISNLWTWVDGTSTLNSGGNLPSANCVNDPGYYPPARYENQTVQTSTCSKSFWTYGGSGSSGYFSDLWFYKIDSQAWVRVMGDASLNFAGSYSSYPLRPPNKMGFAIWTDESDNLYIFGGASVNGNRNDMWKFVPNFNCIIYNFKERVFSPPSKKQMCKGDSSIITLKIRPDSSIIIPNTEAEINLDSQRVTIKATQSRAYKLIVYGLFCSRYTDTLDFQITVPKDTIFIDSILSINNCQIQKSTVTIYGKNKDTSWRYSIDTGVTWNTSSIFPNLSQGNYRFLIKNRCNFFDTSIYVRTYGYDSVYFLKSMCEKNSYYFNNQNLTSTGLYRDTFISSKNCDSFVFLDLKVIKLDTNAQSIFLCLNDTFKYLDSNFSQSGIHTYLLKNRGGCDSLMKFTINFNSYMRQSVYKSICIGDSFLGYAATGLYRDTFVRAGGNCDSIRELYLTVHDSTIGHLYVSVCPLDTYYYQGNPHYQEGIYRYALQNKKGCDSALYIHLAKNKSFKTYISKTICVGDSFRNRKQEGKYVDTFKSIRGCDSFVFIDISMLSSPYSKTYIYEACRQFTFRNKSYSATDSVFDTLYNYLGCDSLYRKFLIRIKPNPVSLPSREVIFCDSIMMGNQMYKKDFEKLDTLKTKDSMQCDSAYIVLKYKLKKTTKTYIKVSPDLTEYIKGESVVLNTKLSSKYLWSTGENTQQITVLASESNQYNVVCWDYNGCPDTAKISFNAVQPSVLDFPLAFSPYGTKMDNRIFKPNFNGAIELNSFTVYNRVGEKMYESSTLNNIGWDGKYKGEDAPAGVYSYILKYKANRNIYFKSGEVLLVR